jgi:hypothetical protein
MESSRAVPIAFASFADILSSRGGDEKAFVGKRMRQPAAGKNG